MRLDHLPVIHAVYMVCPEDKDNIRPDIFDDIYSLGNSIGTSEVPPFAQALLGRDS